MELKTLDRVVIKFTWRQWRRYAADRWTFTNNTALLGADLQTFPDFSGWDPKVCRYLAGVSGFQLHFGSNKIYTPGDQCDVLVAMNAALKVNIKTLEAWVPSSSSTPMALTAEPAPGTL